MVRYRFNVKQFDIYKKQYRYRPCSVRSKQVLGFDTETCNGKAFLVACSNGEYVKPESIYDILCFLTKDKFRKTLNFFYNIDFDFFAIAKYLNDKEINDLWYTNHVDIDGYSIDYIRKRMFKIGKHKNVWKFYDLFQYFNSSLEYASSKYLNEHKKEVDVSKFSDMDYVQHNFDTILKYCVQDCILTAKLGCYIQDKFNQLGVSFTNPVSLASISCRYLFSQYPFPKFEWTEYQQYALYSYYGGRFECFKRGYIPNVYEYDLNSAYPFEMSRLPDITLGKWVKETEIPDNVDIGFVKCKVNVYDNYIGSLPYRQDLLVKFPVFKSNEWYMTFDDYKFVVNHNLADIEFIDGWFFYPDVLQYPFRYMQDLYKMRSEAKQTDNGLNLPLKILMNSLYGKFIERVRILVEDGDFETCDFFDYDKNGKLRTYMYKYRTGNIFCPVYASLITSRTRLRLLDSMLRYKDNVIACFTDSIFFDKPVMSSSREFGGWKKELEGEMVLICSGVYSVRTDNMVKTRLRGVATSRNIDLFELLRENRNATNLKFIQKKVMKLGEVMTFYKKWSYNDLNHFVELQKEIDLNGDRKRYWYNRFNTCGELLTNFSDSSILHV